MANRFPCILIFFILFLIRPITHVLAQEGSMKFSHLTINEGLLHNRVFDILQDKDGFIWVATKDGVNKFDGYDFLEYKPKTSTGLSTHRSEAHALWEDVEGNIWIGESNGLRVFNKSIEEFISLENYVNFSLISDAYITSIQADRDNNLWIASFNGLTRFDNKTNTFDSFEPAPENGTAFIRIRSLCIDTEGIIWVGYDNGLQRFDPKIERFIPIPEPIKSNPILRSNSIRKINQDTKGNFWFGTESSGLFHYDVAKEQLKQYVHIDNDNSLPSNIIREVFHASDEEVWIGTREGLSIFNIKEDRFTNYRYDKYDENGLSHNSIWCIMKDNAGSIWMGTYAGGLNVYHPSSSNFHHIKEQVDDNIGVNHRVISSIVQDDEGALWIGTEGGGLNYIDREAGIQAVFDVKNTQGGIVSNNIKALAKDDAGNLWIGTYNGLSYYDKKDKIFKKIFPLYRDSLENRQIYSLATDPDGVWIGTNGAGLIFRNHDGHYEQMGHVPADSHTISSNYVSSLLNTDTENLWVGTYRGLNLLNKQSGKFQHFLNDPNNPNSISNDVILGLFQDSRNWLWVGTDGGGLNIYDPVDQNFYLIAERDGLANNVVYAIEEDTEGNIWVSTNRGLSKIFIDSAASNLPMAELKIQNYTVTDGLQSNQFMRGAIEKGKGGELFFGGINGITTFFPQHIIQNQTPPKVVLTDFLIHNHPVDFKEENAPLSKPIIHTEHIVLTHDQASITFRFAALNFVNPEKNKYAYKLEGFSNNDQWNFVEDQRSATFTNLEAGDYTFMVKAANNDGVWNEIPTEVRLTVLPPYWKTWWAYTIYALFIVFLLYIFYNFSQKNAKLKNKLLFDQMAHEKEQELNQQKLRFFTNISHEIKTPLTLILAPLEKLIKMNEGNNKVANQLMLMQRNGDRLIRLINQLLDFRKFETGNVKLAAAEGDIVKFSKEVFIAFEVYTHQKSLEMRFSSEKEEIMVWFDRDKLEKILYNLLSNAIKFTPEGGQVSLNIKIDKEGGEAYEQGHVILEIVDNGLGISSENIGKVFDRYNHFDSSNTNLFGTGIGLSYSKGLVELHHWELSVISERATGGKNGHTCFTIKLPLGRQHLTDAEVILDFKSSDDIHSYTEDLFPVEPHMQVKKKEVLDNSDNKSPVMLVVEDNVDVRKLVAGNFAEDFEIHEAEDGEQGLMIAKEIIPDIIISDVMMPRMSGIAFCKEIKTDHRTSHIPVILLTARTPLIFKLEGLEIGADDYITKPFNLHFLEARVWNLLDSRQKLRERYRKEFFLQPKDVALNSPDEIFLEKVIKFIEDNISEPALNVEELGKEIGMSRITLYRKIKGLTGQTVVEFIRSFRLKRAAQLLAQNHLQVNEVSYMVGFQDVDYFRKCFKEQFGYTPTEVAKGKMVMD